MILEISTNVMRIGLTNAEERRSAGRREIWVVLANGNGAAHKLVRGNRWGFADRLIRRACLLNFPLTKIR
jgi:hypothetical protein